MGKSWKDGKNRDKKWEKFGGNKKKKGGKPKAFSDESGGKRTWSEYDGDGDYRANQSNTW